MWIGKLKQYLENERRYRPKAYQRLISGLVGWSITFIVYAIYIIKWYMFN